MWLTLQFRYSFNHDMKENAAAAASPQRRRVPKLNRDVFAKTMERLTSGMKANAEQAQKTNVAHALVS